MCCFIYARNSGQKAAARYDLSYGNRRRIFRWRVVFVVCVQGVFYASISDLLEAKHAASTVDMVAAGVAVCPRFCGPLQEGKSWAGSDKSRPDREEAHLRKLKCSNSFTAVVSA